jgi:hypothetical protein
MLNQLINSTHIANYANAYVDKYASQPLHTHTKFSTSAPKSVVKP